MRSVKMIEQLIITLKDMGEKEAAVALLDALSRHSTDISQFDELAKNYFKLNEFITSKDYAEKVLELTQSSLDQYSAKFNVINVSNHANYPERALTLISQLELINPNDSELQLNKAYSLFLMNKKDKAESILRKQLSNPNIDEETRAKILFNLGTYEMLKDEFQSGLKKFLFEGRKLKYWKKPEFEFEKWEGKIEKNRTLIIRTEAGIGDEIVNVRFMKHIENLGMKPVWFTDRKDLLEIFNRNGFKSITDAAEIDLKNNPCWVHSMDIPIYLNLEYKDLWDGPYIKTDKTKSLALKDLFSTDNPKVGIRWQGNPAYEQDLHRSVPFKELFKSVSKCEVEVYSLQRDNGVEEILGHGPITNLEKYMRTFDDTLSIIDNLDLVVTSCTSVAHAAAAMGKETIVLVPISAYYTWCHSMEKSPWYGDNVTLLRQEKPRSWKEPLEKLEKILEAKYGNK